MPVRSNESLAAHKLFCEHSRLAPLLRKIITASSRPSCRRIRTVCPSFALASLARRNSRRKARHRLSAATLPILCAMHGTVFGTVQSRLGPRKKFHDRRIE